MVEKVPKKCFSMFYHFFYFDCYQAQHYSNSVGLLYYLVWSLNENLNENKTFLIIVTIKHDDQQEDSYHNN